MAHQLPTICRRCGGLVTDEMAWTIGHIIEVDLAPHLMWDEDNHCIEHARCNFAAGAAYGNRKRGRRPSRSTSRDW
jgi:5-methylcytosine-specific restriction endonuclease McrA